MVSPGWALARSLLRLAGMKSTDVAESIVLLAEVLLFGVIAYVSFHFAVKFW